jgi:hypothetical protein
METISKKISLEPYITRFPLCYPCLYAGEVVYLDPDSNEAKYVANYGKIPLGVRLSDTSYMTDGSYSALTEEYSAFTESYSARTLSYQTLQDWFITMIDYRSNLYSNSCHGKFENMTDYYKRTYGDDYNSSYSEEQDFLYKSIGGDSFYKWLIDNYFITLDLYEVYDEITHPEITSVYSYEEWFDIVANIGTNRIYYPFALQLLGKMEVYHNEYSETCETIEDCKFVENCCDCVDYFSFGGDEMYQLLSSWVESAKEKINENNSIVRGLGEDKKILYPNVNLNVLLKTKIEDFGEFVPCVTEFETGHTYYNGNITIYDSDVWILSAETEYNSVIFDKSKWARYYDYYMSKEENSWECIDVSEMPDGSGRTVSSLDSFIRPEETIDGLGNVLPGYFLPNAISKFVQPAEMSLLELMYVPGTYANASISEYNGAVTENVYEGDVLWSVKFFCRDWDGNIVDSTVYCVFEGDDVMSGMSACMSSADEHNSDSGLTPTDGIIYADFTYYKGCTFTFDSNGKININDETYIKCVEHCKLSEEVCQYHMSNTESYPLRYYNVIQDVESVYLAEQDKYVTVKLCDFYFKPSVFTFEKKVMCPVFRKEELLGFSDVEKTKDNIYIDRGYATALDRHLRIGEITNYEQLEKYGNGIFQMFDSNEELV